MDKEVLFIEWKGKALCLICRETVAVLKDFNINRHYETKLHLDKLVSITTDRASSLTGKLHWDKLVSITTDRASSLTGKNVGLVKKIDDKVSGIYPGRKVIPLHCIIHQESLCKSVLHIKHIVDPVVKAVNYICSKGLSHRQFLLFLADIESEHTHITFYNSVRW